jgi:hypothetical protein
MPHSGRTKAIIELLVACAAALFLIPKPQARRALNAQRTKMWKAAGRQR